MRSVFIFFILMVFGPGIKSNHAVSSQVVLYVFEGSDWCTNCARLEKNVLSDTVFQKEIIFMNLKVERIDFPQRKKLPSDLRKYNDMIAEKFGFDGTFPTLILFRMDNDRSRRIYYHNENVEEMLLLIRNNLKSLYE